MAKLTAVLALLALLALACVPAPAAAESNWGMAYTFSDNPTNRDAQLEVTWTLTNLAPYQMEVLYLGVNFDWMAGDSFYFNPTSEDPPIGLAPGENLTASVTLVVDPAASLGDHSYHFVVEYRLQDGPSGGWSAYDGKTSDRSDLVVLERDRDGDGHVDSEDAFPDDPDRWEEEDSPGFGFTVVLAAVAVVVVARRWRPTPL